MIPAPPGYCFSSGVDTGIAWGAIAKGHCAPHWIGGRYCVGWPCRSWKSGELWRRPFSNGQNSNMGQIMEQRQWVL